MKANGAGGAQAQPVTFAGIGSSALLGHFFISDLCITNTAKTHRTPLGE
jgi:hypothetical protein